MHLTNLNQPFCGNNILNSTAKQFAKCKETGEGVSIACDFLGKAILVPAVIMVSSNEPKEKKEYAALKNPVAASIQLLMEVPILALGGKIVSNAANKGFFDKKGSDFTYNEKLCKQKFLDAFIKNTQDEKEFIQNVQQKGYSADLAEKFNGIIQNAPENAKNELNQLFKRFESAHKNQFHLKNRICFAAALILTPLLCTLENKLHPKIMDSIYKLRNVKNPPHSMKFDVNIYSFISKTQKDKK